MNINIFGKRFSIPLRISLTYFFLGALWILFSDLLLDELSPYVRTLKEIQILKGWFFMAATAGILYMLVKKGLTQYNETESKLTDRNNKLLIMSRMSQDINSVLESDIILQTLISSAMQLVKAQGGSAGVMDGGRILFTDYNHKGSASRINSYLDEDNSITRIITKTRKPYYSNDAANDPNVLPGIREKLGIYNFICMPILDRGRTLTGCFVVYNKTKKRNFTEQDVTILQGLAATAAIALEHARILKENKSTLEALNESESRFRTAMMGAPYPAAIFASDGKVLQINDSWINLTGYSRDELKTVDEWMELAHGQEKWKYLDTFKSLFSSADRIRKNEVNIKTKNGSSLVWEFSSAKLGRLPDGRSLLISIGVDVTDRKAAEAVARRVEEERTRILNLIPAMVFYKDLNHRLIWVNDAFVMGTGIPRQELLNRSVFDIFPPEEADYYLRDDDMVVSTGFAKRDIIESIRTPQGLKWYKTDKLPFYDEQNNIQGVIGFANDITQMKEIEEDLIQAKEHAQEADKLKTEFLAQMSHEIRSPINTILNYISLIRDEVQHTFDEDLRYSFTAIDSSSRRLIRTIDLILNMSQLQTGHFEVFPREIDLFREIIQPVAGEMMRKAKEKNLEICLVNNAGDCNITADPYTAGQIFANIIDNAIKYTNEGGITVSVYNENGRLCADVKDTGIGISEEYLAKIFTPFLQEEGGYTRKFDGNGLGLALVRRYCELNNAELRVRSRKGEGTTFTVVLQKTR